MNGDDILGVLKEIRDEVKQTNVRLEETNARLGSLEGRTDFLERRVTKGFESLMEGIEAVSRRQTESEMRVATELLAVADVIRDVRDLFSRKLDDHALVLKLDERVRALEDHRK